MYVAGDLSRYTALNIEKQLNVKEEKLMNYGQRQHKSILISFLF